MYRFSGTTAIATATAAALIPGVAVGTYSTYVKPAGTPNQGANSTTPSGTIVPPEFEFRPAATKRLAFLASLEEDHDGEGAAAADAGSVDNAILFVRQLPYYSPEPLVGLNSDGHAVVEFHEQNEIGQIVFLPDGFAEVYFSREGYEPVGFEGKLDDKLFASKFLNAFGFRFEA